MRVAVLSASHGNLTALEAMPADGHTHRPVAPTRIVNPGAAGLPLAPGTAGSCVLLKADSTGTRLRHRRVPYDRAQVAQRLNRLVDPGRTYLLRHLA